MRAVQKDKNKYKNNNFFFIKEKIKNKLIKNLIKISLFDSR